MEVKMQQFYGELWGRSKTSRIGTKESGLETYVRGKNIGVKVELKHLRGEDYALVSITQGTLGRDEVVSTQQFRESLLPQEYHVTGVDTSGKRFKLIYKDKFTAMHINLYSGTVWEVCPDGARKKIKEVKNG